YQQQLFARFLHFAQFHRAHESADHQAAPVNRNVFTGLDFRHARHRRVVQKIDDGAADRYFAADIHEDADDAQNYVRIFERSGAALNFPFADVRQVDEKKDGGQHEKDDAESQIRNFDRFSAVRAAFREILINEIAANQRSNRGANGIETLSEVQSTG